MSRPPRPSGPAPISPPPEFDDALDGGLGPGGTPEFGEELIAPADLKRKTAKSIIWTVVRTGSDYLLSFAVFAVLARQLGPAAFGVFALAAAFAEFGRILPTTGLVSVISRAKSVSPQLADTVFWGTLGVGVVVAALVALLARPVAAAVGHPEIGPLLTALGLIFPISALGATHIVLMLRQFGHRAMATRSVVSGVLGGAAALVAAHAGWGAWSLVVQRGVTEVAGTLMAWQAYRWLPGRRYSPAVLRSVAGFSSSMTITSLLFVALVRIQDIVIGRMIGVASVGVYRTAWRTVDLISQGAIMPFAQVSLPVLARLQDDLPAFRRAYLRIIAVSAAIAFPAILGFAVLAPAAVPLIFGQRWAESAAIARILGLMAVPFTLNYFAGPALAALGRSGTLARIAALQVGLTVMLSILAAPFGLRAIAAAYVLRAYLTVPVQMYVFKRYSGLPYRAVLAAVAPAFGVALLMALVLLGLYGPLAQRLTSPALFIPVMAAIGATVYGGSLLIFARRFVVRQIEDLRRLVPGLSARLSGAGA